MQPCNVLTTFKIWLFCETYMKYSDSKCDTKQEEICICENSSQII